MNKIFNICALIFSMLILFSCEPGRDVNGDLLFGIGGSGDGGTTTSRLLTKMSSHTQDYDTGEMVDETLTFAYQGNKLISYKDQEGNVTTMEYNSSNRISKMTNAGQIVTLEYSGANVSKMTSDIAGMMKSNSTYTYNGSQLTKVVTIYDITFPLPMKMYMESNHTYTGTNTTKTVVKNGVYDDQGNLIMNPVDQAITFTYDDKKSPYKLLPSEFLLYLAGMGPQGGAYLSTNNFNSIKMENEAGVVTNTYTLIYDAENYPTKTSSANGEFILYEYK